MKTIEQERAEHVIKRLAKIKIEKDFVSYANSLPSMIHTNGLGQTIAFYHTKETKAHTDLITMLEDWLKSPGRPYENSGNVMKSMMENDMIHYMAAQKEAIAYCSWIKKMAKAEFLAKEDT